MDFERLNGDIKEMRRRNQGLGLPVAVLAAGQILALIVIFNLLGNVLEPRFLGKTLSLSPLVVFVSLMFWGWYFGVIGVILSVPLTVGIGIVCQHIEPLQPIAVLLSDKPRPPKPAKRPAGERAR